MDEIIKILDKDLVYVSHEMHSETMLITIKSTRQEIRCPYCNTPFIKVHSKYIRKFQDLPIQCQKVVMTMDNRKMFCNNADCLHKTFAEHFSFLKKNMSR